ncbi:DUF4405 domain-containing protein [Roseibium aggregatum]|uniref:DUF4405 domain-containing protein n=1 Tax=Roseibium aggregatum TaxID=187304 RepID=A0A939EC05_9HYPH|nr:DUF4405 domain-containing protein [Roseibium aggregatum]MBN9670546.1 DUF4405 domain-containing protein [Roseibium aggregatum]
MSLRGSSYRLSLVLGASLLLLLCFAYWWLGNLAHELFGTALFLVLGFHIRSNLNWWCSLPKGNYTLRRAASVAITALLASATIVLMISSLLISRSVFAFLSVKQVFVLREVHWYSAYWMIALVGLHIGLNWSRLVSLMRNLTGLRFAGVSWKIGSATSALILLVLGLESAAALDVWTRLTFRQSPVMWDFNADAARFFLHWIAIVGLFAVASCLVLNLIEFGHARLVSVRTNAGKH